MSLLAPLYIAGALAIALPILFHLIRRTPQGRQEFSSLMFLSPSPPRITKRSRIQNWLLLLLRATALVILALAFARPFVRQAADASVTEARGRRVAILIDSSASMSRGDLMTQARRQAEATLDELRPADEVALYRFDRSATPVFGFQQWNALEPARRIGALGSLLAGINPTNDATRIGDALAAVADVLAAGEDDEAGAVERRLILISDMQRGGQVEALQRHDWPKDVTLEVRPVALKDTTNAAMQLVRESEVTTNDTDRANHLRVRVSNEPGGSREQFTLSWANRDGKIAATEMKTYVPPGRSQVVRLALPEPGARADRLVLSGDNADFDNTLFVVPPRKESVRIIYVGDDAADDIKGLQYYARSALGETPRRVVEWISRKPSDALSDADVVGARLIIVTNSLADDRLPPLRRFISGGGDVLWVLREASSASALARLMARDVPEVSESPERDFALVARIETDHPLLAPFAEARFGDFSRIHFWKHRRVKVDEGSAVRVLARFDRGEDRGDPFLIEQTLGRGRLFVMTSGWHPGDSQLALSTKFVPLMEGFLQRRDAVNVEAQYAVGEPIALPPAAGGSDRTVIGPDGKAVTVAASAATFDQARQPGIYRLVAGGEETSLAVNLSSEESRTAPLAVEELEQFGVRLGGAKASAELTERKRQLERTELENRQKLWRWLIAAVIGLLAAETFLAGRLARRDRSRASDPQVTT